MVGVTGFEPATPTSRTAITSKSLCILPDERDHEGGGFPDKSAKHVPPFSGCARGRQRNTACRHPSGDPSLYFLFNPAYGVGRDFYSHREQATALQFVELGLAEPSPIDDLRK